MYADRYQPRRVNRGSLGLSVGIVAPILAAALLASPVVQHFVPKPPITLIDVQPVPPPPKPEPIPKPQPRTASPQPVPVPPAPIPLPSDPTPTTFPDPGPTTVAGPPDGPVSIPTPEPTVAAPPVLVGPTLDSRYADALQPPYPPAETRAGHDGVVTLKVLVGIDGRVKQVEQLAATSDDFWRVTERQALTRWRFKPATRDGIPTEAWRTMTVRFHLAEAE